MLRNAKVKWVCSKTEQVWYSVDTILAVLLRLEGHGYV